MRRFTNSEKDAIKQLTVEGYSLRQISQALGCGKTAVYYHSFKTRGPTCEKARLNFESPEDEGEVLGIFAGDGCLTRVPGAYRYVVRVTFGSPQYLVYVKNLFEKAFSKSFSVKSNGHAWNIETYSRIIYDYFLDRLDFDPHGKSETVSLREVPGDLCFRAGFLKGLLDTDGTLCLGKRKFPRAVFYTTSSRLAEQTSRILKEFGILHSQSAAKLTPGGNYRLIHTRILSRDRERLLQLIKPFRACAERLKPAVSPISLSGLVDQR